MEKKPNEKLIIGLILQIIAFICLDYFKLHDFQVEVLLSVLNTFLIILFNRMFK